MEIAEVTINYKSLKKPYNMTKIENSKNVADFFRNVWSDRMEYVEEFYILLLSRSSHILGYLKVSEGGTAGTIVDPKIVFQGALKCNASAIVLCHNHPSGNLKASAQDIEITKKVKDGGRLMDIGVLDHIILTSDGFMSFADEGLM